MRNGLTELLMMHGYSIRPERPDDFPAIFTFVKEAFATAKVKDGTEQHFVDRLRAGKNYVPDLALLAEEDAAVIGHIMLTHQEYIPDAGTSTPAPRPFLLLAPLAVRLDKRRAGLGAALVQEAFRRARAMGYKAAFLVGDPDYYGRFGFRAAESYAIRHSPGDIPACFVLACELEPGALRGMSGEITLAH